MATLAAQQKTPSGSTPQFRTGVQLVQLVQLAVLVTDKDGRTISDLNASEFQLREDGRAQSLEDVTFIDIPVASALQTTSPETRGTDSAPQSAASSGRSYVVLLDDLHVSARRTQVVKRLVGEFVNEYVHAGDRAALVFSGSNDSEMSFTTDRAAILAAAERFHGTRLAQPPAGVAIRSTTSALSGRASSASCLSNSPAPPNWTALAASG